MGTILEKILVEYAEMNKNLEENIDSLNTSMKKNTGQMTDWKESVTKGQSTMKKFRMELLGVMFFGMMLQQTMMSLISPALDAYGVFDLFRDMLLVLFIPVMDTLFPILLGFAEFFMNLPEPVQKLIGVLVIFMGVLGVALKIFGAFGLGMDSLAMAFPKIIAAITSFGSKFVNVFKTIGGAAYATIGLLIATIVGLVIAWKENFNNIHAWFKVFVEGIKTLFSGLWQFIKGIVQLIIGIFTLDLGTIKTAFANIFGGLWKIVTGTLTAILGLAVTIGSGLLRAFQKPLDWIAEKFKQVFGWASELVGSVWNKVKGFFGGGTAAVTGGSFGDFIWRPGQAPVAVSPNDTIVGTKSGTGTGGQITIAPVYNINVSDKFEMRKLIEDNNKKLVEDVRRLVKA